MKIRPYEPLWKRERRDLLNEFLQLGFKATIIVIKQGALSSSFLGRTLDQQVITDMEKTGIDPSGEKGEYHTVVTDGPIFSSAIHLQLKDQVVRDGYCFLDVSFIIWGAPAKLVSEDVNIQKKVKEALDKGVHITACKACADQLGVTKTLEKLKIEVKYWGVPLTEILTSEEKLLTI